MTGLAARLATGDKFAFFFCHAATFAQKLLDQFRLTCFAQRVEQFDDDSQSLPVLRRLWCPGSMFDIHPPMTQAQIVLELGGKIIAHLAGPGGDLRAIVRSHTSGFREVLHRLVLAFLFFEFLNEMKQILQPYLWIPWTIEDIGRR